MKSGTALYTGQLEFDGTNGKVGDAIVKLRGNGAQWTFNGNETIGRPLTPDETSEWHIVSVPTGFCVLALLTGKVDEQSKTRTWYLVQITRSNDSFAKHETNETCSAALQHKIAALLNASKCATDPTNNLTFSMSYMMIAPNCDQ